MMAEVALAAQVASSVFGLVTASKALKSSKDSVLPPPPQVTPDSEATVTKQDQESLSNISEKIRQRRRQAQSQSLTSINEIDLGSLSGTSLKGE